MDIKKLIQNLKILKKYIYLKNVTEYGLTEEDAEELEELYKIDDVIDFLDMYEDEINEIDKTKKLSNYIKE